MIKNNKGLSNRFYAKLLFTIIISIQFQLINLGVQATPINNLSVIGGNISDSAKVVVDGKTLEFDVPPQNVNGRILVPLRKIFETLETQVNWIDETKTIIATSKNGTTIEVKIDVTTAIVNGKKIILDVPAQIFNERTLVPARFISESLGYKVLWDETNKTVNIGKDLVPTPTVINTTQDVYSTKQVSSKITYEDRLEVEKCIKSFFEALKSGDNDAAAGYFTSDMAKQFLSASKGEIPTVQQIELIAQNHYPITSVTIRAFLPGENPCANYNITQDTPTVSFDIGFVYTDEDGNSVDGAFIIGGEKIDNKWYLKVTSVG